MSSLVISGPGGEALFTMMDDCLMMMVLIMKLEMVEMME